MLFRSLGLHRLTREEVQRELPRHLSHLPLAFLADAPPAQMASTIPALRIAKVILQNSVRRAMRYRPSIVSANSFRLSL